MPVSRDFRGRRRREAEPDRLPPGQYEAGRDPDAASVRRPEVVERYEQ